jgi:hypothetical protein
MSAAGGRLLSMTTAQFKELCLDTHPTGDVGVTDLSTFWARATGCEQKFFVGSDEGADTPSDPHDAGDVVGPEEGANIAICWPVPEAKTVKHRVHLDVSVASLDELLDIGATVLREPDGDIRWTVMADPEGGEFCAFVQPPDRLAQYRVFELVVDSVDAEANARWWAEAFGVEAQKKDDYWWFTDAPGFPSKAIAPFWAMVFGNVPEPKKVKNRLHWDVYGDVAEFVARGATVLWEMPRWTTMADPEGNEFCVFAPR